MNIMNRVTWQTMKKNRVRTIVTIIGIILSTAMFTAVFALCTSTYNYMREAEIASSGSYHMYAMHVSDQAVKQAAADERTEYTALARNLGYARFDSLNPDKPFICVLAADETFFANMPVRLVEGRLPENENELVIPTHLASNGGKTVSVGDTLTLDLGERRPANPENGDLVLYQENGYGYENEQLVDINTREFKVVGLCDRPDFEPFSAPGYTAITKLSGETEDDAVYECWLRVRNPRRNFFKFTEEHPELAEFGYEEHSGLLMMEGSTRYSNIAGILAGFAVILSLLVFIGSVALIYSAFSISVSERTKQFGLLSSIGSTKKQVRRSVQFEALSLSAIGIPLGVLAGLGGIALTLFLLRDKFSGLMQTTDVPMHLHVTWPFVLAAAVVALVTVLVSAWIPSKRAMRVSPMEAIRQTRDVSVKGGSARYPKLFSRLFGAEGMLAKKYFTRSSKKYRATIVSLAMSVILFVAASAFCLSITRSVNTVDNRPNFDGYFSVLSRQDFARVRPSLTECVPELAGYVIINNGEDMLYADIPASFKTDGYEDYINKRYAGGDSLFFPYNITTVYMDDAAFRDMLAKNGIGEAGFFDPASPMAIVANHTNVTNYERQDNGDYKRMTYSFDFLNKGVDSLMIASRPKAPEGYTDCDVYWSGSSWGEGELRLYCCQPGVDNGNTDYTEVEFDSFGRPVGQPTVPLEYHEVRIGGMVEEVPVGAPQGQSCIVLLYPMSVYTGESDAVSFFFRSDDPQSAIADMKGILEGANVPVNERSFYDVSEEGRLMNNVVTIVKVFSYGFIALISLISIANVFNTVSTNVALRRRDYAMLRSMGMTGRGMNRMSNFECLIYGTRSLLIGLPIAVAIAYLIHRVASDATVMKFKLPWTAILIAIVSVFIVVFASMLYSTGKLKKDNPIDALKDENI